MPPPEYPLGIDPVPRQRTPLVIDPSQRPINNTTPSPQIPSNSPGLTGTTTQIPVRVQSSLLPPPPLRARLSSGGSLSRFPSPPPNYPPPSLQDENYTLRPDSPQAATSRSASRSTGTGRSIAESDHGQPLSSTSTNSNSESQDEDEPTAPESRDRVVSSSSSGQPSAGERFSYVLEVFNVAHSRPQSLTSAFTPQPVNLEEPAHDQEENFAERVGSNTALSNADRGPPAQSRSILAPAVIRATEELQSLTAQAALREHDSLDSSSQQVHHYEGCMLCEPLPSPDSSISSIVVEPYYHGDKSCAPPPDLPLPEHHSLRRHPGGPGMEPGPLKSYLEGEVVPGGDVLRHKLQPRSPGFVPAALGAGASTEGCAYVKPVGLLQTQPVYSEPANGESLSTLTEADEDGSNAHNRQPSHMARLRASHDANWCPQETNHPRPSTSMTVQSNASSRGQTNFGESEYSLARAGTSTTTAPLIEAQPRVIAQTWVRMGCRIMGRKRTDPPPVIPPVNIEMTATKSRPLTRTNTLTRERSLTRTNTLVGGGPHPGDRRDQPGTDGTYEIVDLGPPVGYNGLPTRLSSCNIIGRLHRGKNGHARTQDEVRKARARQVQWLLGFLLIMGIVIMVIFPTLFVGFPNMAQRSVNKAAINTSSVIFSNVQPSTFDLNTQVFVNKIGTSAVIDPTSLRMALQGADLPTPVFTGSSKKRNHIEGHTSPRGSNSTAGILGYLKVLQKTRVGENVDNPLALTGGVDGSLTITNVQQWGEIFEAVVFDSIGYTFVLDGKVTVRVGGLKADCTLTKKPFTFPGMGGVKLLVPDYRLLEQGASNFTATLEVTTNSRSVLNLGTVHFDLLLDSLRIGRAVINNMTLEQGIQRLEMVGTIDRNLLNEDSEQYGKLLTTLYIGGTDTTLRFQGSNVTSNGREVPWLLPVIRRFSVPLSIAAPLMGSNFTQGFGMSFKLSTETENASVSNGSMSTNLTLPFDARGLTTIINKISRQLVISSNGRELFELDTPMASAVSNNNNNRIVAKFGSAKLTVIDQLAYGQEFLKPLLQRDSFSVDVLGNITMEVGTTLGKATITNLPQADNAWALRGYGNFTDGSATPKVTDVVIKQVTSGALVLVGSWEFTGTGSLDVELGPVLLDVHLEDGDAQLGVISISRLSLKRGNNDIEISLAVQQSTAFTAFINAYFAGSGTAIRLTSAKTAASKVTAVAAALDGMRIPASFKSPGYLSMLQTFTLVHDVTRDTLNLQLGLQNPFLIALDVTGFKLTLSASGSSLGSITTPSFSGRTIGPSDMLTLNITFSPPEGKSVNETAEAFIQGGTQVAVSGSAFIAWSDFATEVTIENLSRAVEYRMVDGY